MTVLARKQCDFICEHDCFKNNYYYTLGLNNCFVRQYGSSMRYIVENLVILVIKIKYSLYTWHTVLTSMCGQDMRVTIFKSRQSYVLTEYTQQYTMKDIQYTLILESCKIDAYILYSHTYYEFICWVLLIPQF